jgi:formate dehydrogenase major subunit
MLLTVENSKTIFSAIRLGAVVERLQNCLHLPKPLASCQHLSEDSGTSCTIGGREVEFSRRTFLKSTLVGGVGVSALGFDLTPVYAQTASLKISRATETRSTCPYCSVSCGVLIYTLGDKAKNAIPQVVHVEGDPDHPINRGTLCPKGSSLEQDILNDRRLLKPQVRRPGGTDWEDISWDQAYAEIAQKVKKTRDDSFLEKDAAGKTVNRCEGMAFTGGCTDTNEFNYLVVKTMRSLGVCYLENQARV